MDLAGFNSLEQAVSAIAMSGLNLEPRLALEKILGHRFSDDQLLQQAVTHGSLARSVFSHGYERLEFLGDRVLNMIVAAMLYRQFPDEAEGKLSMRHVDLVRKETLAELAGELGLDALIEMTPGEEQGGIRESATVLADVTEAVIAALYLDGGLDAASAFVERNWSTRMTSYRKPPRDAKTRLQEWALGRALALPTYTMLDKTGPAHAPTITVSVNIDGLGEIKAEGPSRRVAEQDAARVALETFADGSET